MLGQLTHNLPAPRTSLIGRERDVAQTCDLVVNGTERLVTLTGVGGSGKTRLALQVAADVRHSFPDGVWFIELARISDPLLVPETVAAALGFQEVSSDTVLNALLSALQSRAMLVVLDNCEHLIDACADLADSFLSACPNVRILATSREPLQISGERQRRVLPLPVPNAGQVASPNELARYPAVQLFVERASAVEGSFALTPENAAAVSRICTLLDGIPLALELAAARMRVLSAEQIVERLDDCFRFLVGNRRLAPTRQQTLKATLDWSYDLLSAHEKMVFRRLSVFSGDWVLEGAEAVCAGSGREDMDVEDIDVLDVLGRLVDKSLVLVQEQGGEACYRLLEPVRQYGRQRLVENREVETAEARLAAFCVALAERADCEIHGPRQAQWLRRLDREFDNIRAVLHRAHQQGDVKTVLHLAGSLYWHFWMRRHLREGVRWLEAAQAGDVAAAPKDRARGLFGLAMLLAMLGEYRRGLVVGREALDLYRELGDRDGLAMVTVTMAMMTLSQGELPAARTLAEQTMAFAGEVGAWLPFGHALVLLALVVHRQGDTSQALELHERALALFRQHGDSWSISYALASLASIQQNRPDVTLAAALSTVQHYWEQNDYSGLAAALEYLASQITTGRVEQQVMLFAAAHCLRKSLGLPLPIGERDDVERHLGEARERLGEARFTAAWTEGSAMSLEQVVASVLQEDGSPPPKPETSSSRPTGPSDALTRREREVARLLAQGYTDRQIAQELTITEGTAGVHVHRILEKLGLRSRVQVVDWALAQGLIDTRPD